MNSPLVSIILPCYNMEKYLERCVDSILNNKYRPLEIILVNDGSNDSTPDIINRLEEHNDEVRALHKTNGGVSSARNAGIKIAKGEYIMFVDPDDMVEDDFISSPVEKAIKEDADLVFFGYKSSWYSNPPIMKNFLPSEDLTLCSQDEIFKRIFSKFFGMTLYRFKQWLKNDSEWYNGKELSSACMFLYKRDFIEHNSLEFRNLKLGEDATFVWDCLLSANRLSTSMNSSYVYIPLQQGTLATTTSADKILDSKLKILEQRDRIAEEIKHQRGKNILNLYAGSNIISALQIGLSLAKTGSFSKWKKYLKKTSVNESISCITMSYRGG